MLQIQFTAINADKGHIFSEWTEDVEQDQTAGQIYKTLQSEYGRCTGKVYQGEGQHIGWCFIQKKRYEDTNEQYLQETWCMLVDYQPATYTPVTMESLPQ